MTGIVYLLHREKGCKALWGMARLPARVELDSRYPETLSRWLDTHSQYRRQFCAPTG